MPTDTLLPNILVVLVDDLRWDEMQLSLFIAPSPFVHRSFVLQQ